MSPDTERRGFSLLEVLIAVVVLGVGVVGILQSITSALTSSRRAEQLTTAVFLAGGLLEELRAQGQVALEPAEKEGDFGDAFAHYRWRRQSNAREPEGLYHVVVIVENDHHGAWQPIETLETLIFEMPASEDGASSAPGDGPADGGSATDFVPGGGAP